MGDLSEDKGKIEGVKGKESPQEERKGVVSKDDGNVTYLLTCQIYKKRGKDYIKKKVLSK